MTKLAEHMVARFLTWKLPSDFNPDGGISFKNVFGQNWPVGTNLLTRSQAEEMVGHMLIGVPEDSPDQDAGSGLDAPAFRMIADKGESHETIPMILFCPNGHRHIDEGEFATNAHHTHACQECGIVWRPAKVNTHGVRFLPGYRNDPVAEAMIFGEDNGDRTA